MKATELMIGDLVTFKDSQNDEAPIVVRIWQINGADEALVKIDGDEALDEIEIDDNVVGIPITAEILKKNGFGYIEKDEQFMLTHYYLGTSRYCKNMDLHIGTNNSGDYWINDRRNSLYGLHYVHELQHVLRLWNIEKEIVL